MKASSSMKIFSILSMSLLTSILHAQNSADSAAIKNILQEQIDAWNKGDAEMYSRHFATDGTFTNIMGMFFTGHKTFLEKHDQIFKGPFLGTTALENVVSLRFVNADVAVVETLTWVSGFKAGPPKGATADEKGRLRTRLLQVLVRNGADWKITMYHNVDVKPGIPAPEPNEH